MVLPMLLVIQSEQIQYPVVIIQSCVTYDQSSLANHTLKHIAFLFNIMGKIKRNQPRCEKEICGQIWFILGCKLPVWRCHIYLCKQLYASINTMGMSSLHTAQEGDVFCVPKCAYQPKTKPKIDGIMWKEHFSANGFSNWKITINITPNWLQSGLRTTKSMFWSGLISILLKIYGQSWKGMCEEGGLQTIMRSLCRHIQNIWPESYWAYLYVNFWF